jgi:ATP-dependent protease ClpP protease subunit
MIKGLQIRAKAERAAEILIYSDIGESWFSEGLTAKAFLKELRALGDLATIDVRINSNGGSVFDGLAIYNGLKAHKARKTVHIDGIAASIASVIAMAGDEIRMGEGAFIMVHSPYTLAAGNAEELRETADLLESIEAQLVGIYAARTGLSAEAIGQMLAAETWLNAEDAARMGFADAVAEPIRLAASARPEFKNAPAILRAMAQPAPQTAPHGASKGATTMTLDEMRARAGELQQQAAAIREKAATEKRPMSADEINVVNDFLDQFDQIESEIKAQLRLERAEGALAQGTGRVSGPAPTTPSEPGRIQVVDREPNKWGWKSFGEFCNAVKNIAVAQKVDPRLVSNATLSTYGNEGTGADGGFAVPPEWRSEIMKAVAAEDGLLSRTDQQISSGNSITFPKDEAASSPTGTPKPRR